MARGRGCGDRGDRRVDGTYRISVARISAEKPSERIGVLTFNPGGPGSAAVSNITWVQGMLPQRVHSAGYRRRGLTPEDQKQILIDAQAVAAAGAFAIVVECVDEKFMPKITEAVSIPTIGIGSGRGCDGQILVIHDLLGLTPEPPPFARPEANLHRDAVAAVRRWATKVRAKKSK